MTRFSYPLVALLSTLLVAFAVWPSTTQAWGPQGHRLIGALAEAELSREARQEVARLLRGESNPTLAGIANWADDLRDNPSNPDAVELGRRTSRWHFVNIAEDGCAYAPAEHCRDGDCVVEAIRRQEALLADRRQPDAVRAQALKFLVHLIGDVHQPLHAGYARDRGGNTHQLQIRGLGSNLHRVWDSDVVTAISRNELRNFRRMRALDAPQGADDTDPARWAEASCRIVLRDGFYPPKGALAPGYPKRWAPTADMQMRLAAEHLAQSIERALATPTSSEPRKP